MKLSILIYGLESEKQKLSPIMNAIQEQLNRMGDGYVDIVYRINDEESIEQKKAWLLSQTECKKYVFVTIGTEIPDNFLILRYTSVKLRKPTKKLLE